VRFEVSQVMDAIERRLTTDPTLAQAVLDLGDVVRCTGLDGGRPISLIRAGMAVDALSRFLVDAGAMLYAVAGRDLLSDSAMTSKERMVLGRWAEDGLIEVTREVAGRAVEVADFTGLPLIAVEPVDDGLAKRFPWLVDTPERILRLAPRSGFAVLTPTGLGDIDRETARAVVVGKAAVAGDIDKTGNVDAFVTRGAHRLSHTLIARRRFTRAEPSAAGAPLLARQWRCEQPDCAMFGEFRTAGQPVPTLHKGKPVCPRHGEKITDVGERPPAYAVSVVVDDLARRRFTVRAGAPVHVGKSPDEDETTDISVGAWLHEAAEAWIDAVHIRLEIGSDGGLVVTDLSENGTLVWQRSSPDERPATKRLHRASYALGDWDSVELYTGLELVRGDRRLTTVVGSSDPLSVLVNAPTVAVPQLSPTQ